MPSCSEDALFAPGHRGVALRAQNEVRTCGLAYNRRHPMPITRRELLCGLAAATAASAIPGVALAQSAPPPRIDPARLRHSLEALSVFGRPEGGTFGDGVSRVGYSDADVAGRKYAMELMREAGLDPRIDTAGNIFGTRDGSERGLKPILFGSHIDSVPSGGNFDGELGSLSAIEVIRTLKERGVVTRHPLQVVIWQNEEGGLVGSHAAFGDALDLEREFNGVRSADGCGRSAVTRTGSPRRAWRGSVHRYLSCTSSKVAISTRPGLRLELVEVIVSIDAYDVRDQGLRQSRRNHADGRMSIMPCWCGRSPSGRATDRDARAAGGGDVRKRRCSECAELVPDW